MRKSFLGFALIGVFVGLAAFGQPPSPTETPSPSPILVSTATPTPAPSITANNAGTVSVPSTLTTPIGSPTAAPTEKPVDVRSVALNPVSLGWTERGAPVFTIEQAVITALQQNPDIRRTLEEIRRTKGVVIEFAAQALPHIGPNATINWTDPNLRESSSFSTFGGLTTPTPAPTITPTPPPGSTPTGIGGVKNLRSDLAYEIKVTGTQLVFNYSTFRAIRGTFFQRDSAYFALR